MLPLKIVSIDQSVPAAVITIAIEIVPAFQITKRSVSFGPFNDFFLAIPAHQLAHARRAPGALPALFGCDPVAIESLEEYLGAFPLGEALDDETFVIVIVVVIETVIPLCSQCC
ncbi:hypothetical protein [Phyllobacterium myrsinacearum]|uniref:Uncharacterized protein n=1 Tax=Phyllobacterium myrsinacearum TaxID=28101 RepID=A0A839E8W9_9HYPH|nr:hypothetical protein [Phyllobacterium myrsinacearum]MBA8876321.1 hypothetical protein [Phyllobacterium myrsinacearum]